MTSKSWMAIGGGTRMAMGLGALFSVLASAADVTAVTRTREGVFAIRDGVQEALTNEVVWPNGVKVMTNGVFTVNEGKERTLREGQRLGADGFLLGPGARLEPVQDHVAIEGGKVVVVKDGDSQAAEGPVTLGNGNAIMPDLTLQASGVLVMRLIDGQLFNLSGAAIPAQDTILMLDGKVLVQKDGSVLPVRSDSNITMNEGTRVFGNGRVQRMDGTSFTLTEGQMVRIEGVVRLR
jgi:hypothetical protein